MKTEEKHVVWRSFLVAAAALTTPTRNVYNAQGLKVLCSYELTAMVKFALLMYMSEFRLRVSSFD